MIRLALRRTPGVPGGSKGQARHALRRRVCRRFSANNSVQLPGRRRRYRQRRCRNHRHRLRRARVAGIRSFHALDCVGSRRLLHGVSAVQLARKNFPRRLRQYCLGFVYRIPQPQFLSFVPLVLGGATTAFSCDGRRTSVARHDPRNHPSSSRPSFPIVRRPEALP